MKLKPPEINNKTLNKFPKCEINKIINDFFGGGVIQFGPFSVKTFSASEFDNPKLLCILFTSILVLNLSATSSMLSKCSIYN